MKNGVVGGPTLPKGQNEADSNLISVQNGTVGSNLLPAGQNEAVSKLISANNGASTSAILKQTNSLSVTGSSLARNITETPLTSGVEWIAGETVSVVSDVPAQIWLNSQRAGNDPNSAVGLTFVVPEQGDSLAIRPGDSAESITLFQRRTAVLTGQVVNAAGLGVANAHVHLRHAGLKAEFFHLTSNAPPQEVPAIAELTPSSEEPVSSLNLHNPNQALGYFPIGSLAAPNFAIRFTGQILAQSSGTYLFQVAATEGAQLSIDGRQISDVHNTKPGLESAASTELVAGWHDISLLVYAKTTYAELVLSFTPPGGTKQVVGPQLLRSESTVLSALSGEGGKFTITAPAWLDQVEAMATDLTMAGPHSGISAVVVAGQTDLGQVHLAASK